MTVVHTGNNPRPRLWLQLLLLATRWQACYAAAAAASSSFSAEPDGMWRTVPYSNAAGRRKGFHNLLFLLGERRRGVGVGSGEGGKGRGTGDTRAGDMGEACVV